MWMKAGFVTGSPRIPETLKSQKQLAVSATDAKVACRRLTLNFQCGAQEPVHCGMSFADSSIVNPSVLSGIANRTIPVQPLSF